MSTIKTTVSQEQLDEVLESLKLTTKPQITPLKSGELSMAYDLEFPEQSLILRINSHSDMGFWKDAYAFENFSKYGIRIPRIITNGKIGTYYYSLSEKCPGRALDTLDSATGRIIEQSLFAQLIRLFAIPPMGSGYGVWGKDLQANKTDAEASLSYDTSDRPGDLNPKSFTDLEAHRQLRDSALALKSFLPQQRYLIHGDPGFNNAFGAAGQVTGLIDWASSSYGDFLFDIAWLMFWNQNALHSDQEFLAYLESNHVVLDLKHFHERITCHMLNIGFGCLNFFARSDQEQSYQDTLNIIKHFALI